MFKTQSSGPACTFLGIGVSQVSRTEYNIIRYNNVDLCFTAVSKNKYYLIIFT